MKHGGIHRYGSTCVSPQLTMAERGESSPYVARGEFHGEENRKEASRGSTLGKYLGERRVYNAPYSHRLVERRSRLNSELSNSLELRNMFRIVMNSGDFSLGYSATIKPAHGKKRVGRNDSGNRFPRFGPRADDDNDNHDDGQGWEG